MKIWIIEYCDANGVSRDCYPDFCYSADEAHRIAPEFMTALNACGTDGLWAKSWRIVEEEMPLHQGPRPPEARGAALSGNLSVGRAAGSTGCVREPWQMGSAEWDAAAERGRIVQDQGPARDLQAVLSGEKPATHLDIHEGHVLSEMYETGELEERVRAGGAILRDDHNGGVIIGRDGAAVARLEKALNRVRRGEPSIDLGRAYGYAPEDVAAFFKRSGWDYNSFMLAAREEGLASGHRAQPRPRETSRCIPR